MELRVMSDLHLEIAGRGRGRKDPAFELTCTDADRDRVLVLAGDTDVDRHAAAFAARQAASFRAVVQVLGNHEYYKGGSPQRLPAKLREHVAAAGTENVHVLDDATVDVGGVRFIGATLWTDFNGADPEALRVARNVMNDFQRIRCGTEAAPYAHRFLPQAALRLHRASTAFIEQAVLSAHAAAMVPVVVTHHAPYPPEGPDGSPLSFSYGSDLGALIHRARPALWIHGHTHECVDTTIHGCRVVANGRGYAGIEPVPGFDPARVVRVAPAAATEQGPGDCNDG
ncbi:metallophosphoesterase [Aquisalimonas lutea]|uniref:metallophosphoesterase n=1 Tax=Aquisalimonas lutea TaxID=1327750 RepID=UPI0025B48A84|nr:metallophosphoesterase [Aquisalimonas lutea]MDN3517262.1 metallophosphoesterase [Aquisalimonas lutea]